MSIGAGIVYERWVSDSCARRSKDCGGGVAIQGIAEELSSERQGLRDGVLKKSVVAVVWRGGVIFGGGGGCEVLTFGCVSSRVRVASVG